MESICVDLRGMKPQVIENFLNQIFSRTSVVWCEGAKSEKRTPQLPNYIWQNHEGGTVLTFGGHYQADNGIGWNPKISDKIGRLVSREECLEILEKELPPHPILYKTMKEINEMFHADVHIVEDLKK